MTQYINKDALVAEIERYKHKADERLKIKGRTLAEELKDSALQNLCGNLLHFIDTLEVKEVDLTKKTSDFIDTYYKDAKAGHKLIIRRTARYFFNLGLIAQKGE